VALPRILGALSVVVTLATTTVLFGMIFKILPDAPIEVMPGKCVCEIKPSGFSKASGVIELMSHQPFKGRRPVFVGDDVTDESVFAIMPDFGGLAFSVGRRATGVTDHFDEPREVREWLARLVDDEANAAGR